MQDFRYSHKCMYKYLQEDTHHIIIYKAKNYET